MYNSQNDFYSNFVEFSPAYSHAAFKADLTEFLKRPMGLRLKLKTEKGWMFVPGFDNPMIIFEAYQEGYKILISIEYSDEEDYCSIKVYAKKV